MVSPVNQNPVAPIFNPNKSLEKQETNLESFLNTHLKLEVFWRNHPRALEFLRGEGGKSEVTLAQIFIAKYPNTFGQFSPEEVLAILHGIPNLKSRLKKIQSKIDSINLRLENLNTKVDQLNVETATALVDFQGGVFFPTNYSSVPVSVNAVIGHLNNALGTIHFQTNSTTLDDTFSDLVQEGQNIITAFNNLQNSTSNTAFADLNNLQNLTSQWLTNLNNLKTTVSNTYTQPTVGDTIEELEFNEGIMGNLEVVFQTTFGTFLTRQSVLQQKIENANEKLFTQVGKLTVIENILGLIGTLEPDELALFKGLHSIS